MDLQPYLVDMDFFSWRWHAQGHCASWTKLSCLLQHLYINTPVCRPLTFVLCTGVQCPGCAAAIDRARDQLQITVTKGGAANLMASQHDCVFVSNDPRLHMHLNSNTQLMLGKKWIPVSHDDWVHQYTEHACSNWLRYLGIVGCEYLGLKRQHPPKKAVNYAATHGLSAEPLAPINTSISTKPLCAEAIAQLIPDELVMEVLSWGATLVACETSAKPS